MVGRNDAKSARPLRVSTTTREYLIPDGASPCIFQTAAMERRYPIYISRLKERKAHIPSTIDTFHRHHMSTVHWQIAQAIYSIYVQYPSHLGAALAVMTPTSISSPTRCITIHGRPWTWTWRLGDRTTLTHAAWAFRMISPVSLMY